MLPFHLAVYKPNESLHGRQAIKVSELARFLAIKVRRLAKNGVSSAYHLADDTVSTDNIMAQTPLAIVVKSVADTVQIFVYYISDSNRRLMRATKPLLAGAYQVQSVMPEDSLDDTSDLAVSSVPTGNLVSFMLKGNERYSNIVDQVGVTPS